VQRRPTLSFRAQRSRRDWPCGQPRARSGHAAFPHPAPVSGDAVAPFGVLATHAVAQQDRDAVVGTFPRFCAGTCFTAQPPLDQAPSLHPLHRRHRPCPQTSSVLRTCTTSRAAHHRLRLFAFRCGPAGHLRLAHKQSLSKCAPASGLIASRHHEARILSKIRKVDGVDARRCSERSHDFERLRTICAIAFSSANGDLRHKGQESQKKNRPHNKESQDSIGSSLFGAVARSAPDLSEGGTVLAPVKPAPRRFAVAFGQA